MSRLRLPNGDDYPEAAHKHLLDADSLLKGGRPDGAAYLSGYVAECALKTLFVYEKGQGLPGHNFPTLVLQISAVATVAGAKAARYFGPRARALASSPLGGWSPAMRYRAASMTHADAAKWCDEARAIYGETVHKMRLDGVI